MITAKNETRINRKGEVEVVGFNCFQSFHNLKVCFSTRIGGVSDHPYDRLNLGLKTGDDAKKVLQNRQQFFDAVGIEPDRVNLQRQVHSTNVKYVTKPGDQKSTDACYTDRVGVFLSVFAADCVPIFLFEPESGVCAAVHAGWRGTREKIVSKIVSEIVARFGLNPSKLIAAIGPSISVDRYEVSEEVASNFDETCVSRQMGSRPYLNLSRANALQLSDAGVEEVHESGLCTFENDDLFFSHRRSGGKTGRMLGLIGITKD